MSGLLERILLFVSTVLLWAAIRLSPNATAPVVRSIGKLLSSFNASEMPKGRTGGLIMIPWSTDMAGHHLSLKMKEAAASECARIREEERARDPWHSRWSLLANREEAYRIIQRSPRPPAGRRVMKTDLIERLRAHPDKAVVRHWEDWAQEADTLMREAAAALEAEASERERRGLKRASVDRTAAIDSFRRWFFNHTGKRIFHSNAGVAVNVVLDAALIPEAPAREGE